MTLQQGNEIRRQIPYSGVRYKIIKNHLLGNLTYNEYFSRTNFIYTDEVNLNWKLVNDTTTICNHLCHKATTHFRGRDWVAYYCMDIPINDGPYKFSGLPGLILKIEDTNKDYSFVAVDIYKAKNQIYKKKRKRMYTKVSRKAFNKAKKYNTLNPGAYLIASGSIKGHIRKHSRNEKDYNPIELE